MLNYELFCKVIAERIKDFLPENLKDCDVSVLKVQRRNMDVDELHVVNKGEAFGKCYVLNGLYGSYKRSHSDMTDFLKETANSMAESMLRKNQPENMITEGYLQMQNADKEAFLEKVFFTLENKTQNMPANQNMPSRDYFDCRIVYKYKVAMDDNKMASMAIDNNMMHTYGVTEQELYDAAYKNTRNFFPENVSAMDNIVSYLMVRAELLEDTVKMMYRDLSLESFANNIWIISNDKGVNGSANIIYDDVLSEVSQKAGGDICIFPSSVHECIAIRDDGTVNYKDFAEMVKDINMCAVDKRDRLTNQAYKYDCKKHELVQMADAKFRQADRKEMPVNDVAKKANGNKPERKGGR